MNSPKHMLDPGQILIFIIIIILYIYPDFRAKVLAIVGTLIEVFIIMSVENVIIDAAIDELIDIPDSFCPQEFNRTNYCVEFGLGAGEVSGQLFLTGEVNEVIDIRVETKEDIVRCPLQKGKSCTIAKIKSAKDFKITLTDKKGTAILTSTSFAKQAKKGLNLYRVSRSAKILNKII